MISAIDLSKRALVTLVNSLANVHAVAHGIARESSDGDVLRAYRKLSEKCHRDKGGKRGHKQALNAAFDTWEGAQRAAKHKATQKARDTARRQQAAIVVTRGRHFTQEFRFRGAAWLVPGAGTCTHYSIDYMMKVTCVFSPCRIFSNATHQAD